jgi:KDO2-lipid IV(A) lauroyltransferase
MSAPRIKTAQRPLWHPLCWPAWIGLGLLKLIAVLPQPLQRLLAWVLGLLLPPLLGSRRRIVRRNLQLCFPQLDHAASAELCRRNLRNSGAMVVEFALAWMGSKRRIARLPVHFHGLEHLQAARDAGRGILLVGVHMSHLELAGRLLTTRWPVSGMYREHADPAFEWAIRRARARYATAMFRRDELRAAVKHVKAGGTLWYAPDQDYKRGESVYAPFFDIPAATLIATHQMARLTGAVVLGFAHRRLADGSYEIHVRPALEDFPSSDALVDTTRVNALLESSIRMAPEQYLWMHKRFKRRPPGAPEVY